jgi:hypothetical protein
MFYSKFLQEIERDVAKIVEFKEYTRADMVFGEYDVIATILDNLGKLEEFVLESIRTVPNDFVTSTMIILRE